VGAEKPSMKLSVRSSKAQASQKQARKNVVFKVADRETGTGGDLTEKWKIPLARSISASTYI
jgi:hypothetical protein